MCVEIKSLRTDGFFRRRPIIPPTIQLQLTHLRLASDHPSTSAFLERLLGAEPVLTHLEFSKGVKDTFSQSYNSALHDVARQLLHSTLPVLQCGPTSFNTLDFVASCTSLKSLTLRLASPTSIYKTFASSHAALTLVTTRLNWKWNEGGQGFAKLIAVLELAAVAELKRWRLTKPTVVYMNEAVMGYEHTQAAWEDACRARGVDPRDERRFFTGESPTVSFLYS